MDHWPEQDILYDAWQFGNADLDKYSYDITQFSREDIEHFWN